ncbi:hypothetical protein ACIRON_02735 [Nocardioides sp. NPDC101246]|uniref:hypothetical protein n=1 Tax=Nocardioides sp. NPDC101246 TaxID=3364336 RepID=UPI003810BC56
MTNAWEVTPASLAPIAGVTYAQEVIDVAVLAVKNYLGWPVAPRGLRTVILDGNHTQKLVLPSLDPDAEVLGVRDVTGDSPVALNGWRKLGRPILFRAEGWPCGEGAIEVDLEDGYATLPVDLLPMVANACANQTSTTGGVLKTVSIDDYSEGYDTTGASAAGPTKLHPYRLPRKTA